MLYLVGLGLVDDDITLKGLETIKKCNLIYCELYTNKWMGDLKKLEKKSGKKIKILSREEVESDFIIEKSKAKNIALLVSGDPLTATTHYELLFEAKKKGIQCEVIHAPSIYTSIADTGLQIYKFGRTTTLVYPEKNFSPASPYEVIERNKSLGLHTLVLLDIKEDKQMTGSEGIEILLRLSKELKKKIIIEATKLVVCCRVGNKDMEIKYDTAINLLKNKSIQKTPAVIIIPGDLNFKEEEALSLWK